jgi:aerobic carbon-monoxide dehydrogenase medium subunit
VFVARGPGGVRVAVTGAGPSVFRWSEAEKALGGRFSPDALEAVALRPDGLTGDTFGSPEYRAHLVGVLARRAVTACG